MSEYLCRFIRPPGESDQYRSRLRDMVLNNRFQLSLPSKLNDPFDCKTLFTVKGATFEDLKEYYENTIVRYGDPRDAELAQKALQVAKSDPQKAIRHLRQRYIENHMAELDQFGILCLFLPSNDEMPQDILMWSYYADGHKGFCLQFDKKVLQESFICKPVEYHHQYPSFREIAAKEDEELAELLLFRKSTRWKHENEWRILSSRDITNDFYLSFPPSAFVGMIFGCEADDQDMKDVVDWADQRESSRIRFYRAEKSQEEYRINTQEIL